MGEVIATQFEVLNKDLASKIDKIITENDSDPTRLVGILLDVQDVIPKQYIPKEVAAYVGEELDVPLSRVYDVISFYAALSEKPRADYVVQLCKSIVCRVNGYPKIRENLEEILGINIGEITEDKKFALSYTACFGACDIAPAIRINERVYGNLTEEKIKEIISTLR